MTESPAVVRRQPPDWSLGDRLRRARRTEGLDQATFAAMLGTGQKTYASWESDNSRPRDLIATAKRFEIATGFPAAWLLGMDSPSPGPGASYCGNDDDNSERPQLRLVAHVQTSPSHAATPMDLPAAA